MASLKDKLKQLEETLDSVNRNQKLTEAEEAAVGMKNTVGGVLSRVKDASAKAKKGHKK